MPCRRGKTIRIDLGTGQIKETLTDEALLLNYLGGRGLGVKLLSELIEPELDPLAPENPLIFTSGPLTGLAPMAGRFVLTSKSPLTGTVFSYNAGGTFGKELKWAGIDALLISGKAKEPVYIKLRPEGSKTKVELLPAHPLWGKNTEECTKLLEVFGSVACIGRAGENQVRISSLVNDFIYLGRGGLGAVAGSKKLKAVVVKGEEKPEIFDSAGFKETEKKVLKLLEANSVLSKGFSNYGTPALVRLLNYMKVLPVQNFQANETSFAENYSGELIKARFAPEKEACFNCPIACKQREKEKGKPLPDYASLWAFGLNPEISDLDSVLRLSRLCIDYGLDPLSTGSGLAAYFEYKGKKPDALELEKLIKQIGEGKSKLGEGSRRYFEKKTGTTKLRLDVKGLELAGFDVRGIQGQALAYATSPWGGDFLSAFMVGPELLGKPLSLERLSLKGKAGILQVFENLTASFDSLILCPFAFFALDEKICSNLLQTSTGQKLSGAGLLKLGERIWNLERLFNQGAGFSRADDILPARLYKNGISKEEFEAALSEYYHFRAWDAQGVPLEKKLKELGLQEGLRVKKKRG